MIPILKKALFLGILPYAKDPLFAGRIFPVPTSVVMSPNGRWEVIDSNDKMVFRLKPPVIVNITPNGFSIGKGIFGSFEVEPLHSHSRSGIYVSMCIYNLPFMKKVYSLEPLGLDRIALFGTGRMSTTYYILKKMDHKDCET